MPILQPSRSGAVSQVMNTMARRVQCDRCNRVKQRWEMSCFDAICMDCFFQDHAICADCGRLLRRDHRSRCRQRGEDFLGGDCYRDPRVQRNGEHRDNALCHTCYRDQMEVATGVRIDYWRPKALDVSIATYKRIGSKRKFGVEIETASCGRHFDLHGKTNFGCKGDCSISGLEFDSPILYGDEGLEYIEYFMEFADDHNWNVDEDCGCHTHYDMRDESDESLFRIAYAYAHTYDFWACFVPRYRRENGYCHELSYTLEDIRNAGQHSFSNWCLDNDRYDYINTGAYNQHITFENRLLEGSLDANDICSWITLHCRFMDHVKKLHFDALDQFFDKPPRAIFTALAGIFDNTELTNWMASKSRQYEQPLRGPGSANWTPAARRHRWRRR